MRTLRDSDGDGRLSAEERAHNRRIREERKHVRDPLHYDEDGDGILSEREQQTWLTALDRAMGHRAARLITRADENDDGLLSQEEAQGTNGLLGRSADRFSAADRDGDRLLSQAELKVWLVARRRGRIERRQKRAKASPRTPEP